MNINEAWVAIMAKHLLLCNAVENTSAQFHIPSGFSHNMFDGPDLVIASEFGWIGGT